MRAIRRCDGCVNWAQSGCGGERMLGDNQVLEELSHAWLHLVATQARFGYERAGRLRDHFGVDAAVFCHDSDLFPKAKRVHFSIDFQIRATTLPPRARNGLIPFRLELRDYDRLRQTGRDVCRLLTVVFVHGTPDLCVLHSDAGLLVQARGYWASLAGAPPSRNRSYQNVYLPASQELNPDELRSMMRKRSEGEDFNWVVPTFGDPE